MHLNIFFLKYVISKFNHFVKITDIKALSKQLFVLYLEAYISQQTDADFVDVRHRGTRHVCPEIEKALCQTVRY